VVTGEGSLMIRIAPRGGKGLRICKLFSPFYLVFFLPIGAIVFSGFLFPLAMQCQVSLVVFYFH